MSAQVTPASTQRGRVAVPRRRAGKEPLRRQVTGWLFVAPFALVFLAFLIAPLVYALYLSLFRKALIGGTSFTFLGNYVKAFTDPAFIEGAGFVIRFSLVLIPLQMAISLLMALMLDAITNKFTRFSRLMIFMPYAIPAVIGALMWGFMYSRSFGPLGQLFALIGANAPDFLSKSLIFEGLLNIVTWQWAGYYMIILYAALQGIDPSLYDAARIDGASNVAIALRIKIPLITPALVLILVFALIGTLQFFNEPSILQKLASGAIPPNFTPNMYAYELAFTQGSFNYGSAISFTLAAVVFVCVYIFLRATRKKGGFLS